MTNSAGQNVRPELSQKLSLSLEMRQSLKILEMPLPELYELVSKSISENPLFEMDAAGRPLDRGSGVRSFSGYDDDALASQNRWDYRGENIGDIDDCVDPVENFPDTEETFSDQLFAQIDALRLSPSFSKLCKYIVECLDERGYLDFDPCDLSEELKLPEFDIMQALFAVQNLQPTGVGARSLKECLILQLVNGRDFTPYTVKIVNEGLELLASNDIAGISKLISADMETAAQACRAVKSLNPIPSRGFCGGETVSAVVPDAVIKKEDGFFRVVMNDSIMPRLELNGGYCNLLNKAVDSKTERYVRENLRSAQMLIKNVGNRNLTIARVIECIIGLQPYFFESGRDLSPMTLADIAKALGINISTVSRAVQKKYIVCAAGTVSLKSLFTNGIVNSSGISVSKLFIESKLKTCLCAENPEHPFSDEDLRVTLQAMNIDVSRRTLAKYREKLGIPPSSERKKQKKFFSDI